MNKELEALNRIKNIALDGRGIPTLSMYEEELFNIIEKSFKALEIIKEKKVNVQDFLISLDVGWEYELFEQYCQDNSEYNENPPYVHSMTQEEWELLKEVLL